MAMVAATAASSSTASPLLLQHRTNKPKAAAFVFSASNSSRKNSQMHASSCLSSAPLDSGKPRIKLEFFAPKPEADGSYQKQTAAADSGEKLLRTIMSDNKIELYTPYGKVMNCGGGGSCGTCIVEIIEGQDLLNERTDTEKRYLKKKPESWRLACQTIVGNKENAGKVMVQRLPQWKK